MLQVIVASLVVVVGIVIAFLVRRRDGGSMAQAKRWTVPAQLERRDFTNPAAQRLIVVFSSDTCDACAATWSQVSELVAGDPATALQLVSYQEHQDLHERYGIDAVPTLLMADREGVVQRSFVGPPDANDLADVIAAGAAPQD